MINWGRRIFSVHSWLGLIAGLFILTFFLTGAVIVFREEINRWEHPHLHVVMPEWSKIGYHQIYERVRTQRPDLYLYSFRHIPKKPDETIEMRIYNPATDKYGLLYANPYDGKVLGVTFLSVYDFLLTLHYQFWLGKVGELLAGIFALALVGSVLTGFYVYRKFIWKALTFRVGFNWKNWRTASSSLHRILGAWGLVFNFILAFSGFYMMLYAFDLKAQFGGNASKQPEVPPVFTVHLDSLIAHTEAALQGRFHYLDFPREPAQPITVHAQSSNHSWLWGDYNNYIEYDRQTGTTQKIFREAELSAWTKFEYALYTLHFGQYGGMGIKLLYAFFGLAGAALSISGFLLWYRRKNKKNSRRPHQKAQSAKMTTTV
jgi:uncharacterized iron-regulated membrane protein